MAAVLRTPKHLCYFVCVFKMFLTYFVYNVDATVSYDRKELLDIQTAITHLKLDKDESDTKDIMLLPDKAQISVIRTKKIKKYREIRVPCENSSASG